MLRCVRSWSYTVSRGLALRASTAGVHWKEQYEGARSGDTFLRVPYLDAGFLKILGEGSDTITLPMPPSFPRTPPSARNGTLVLQRQEINRATPTRT